MSTRVLGWPFLLIGKFSHRIGHRSTNYAPPTHAHRLQRRCDSPSQIRRSARLGYEPTMPPPFLTITWTDGRGGIPGWKSGQRVDGLSKVEPLVSPGCCTAAK
jgi:hypothetical protein